MDIDEFNNVFPKLARRLGPQNGGLLVTAGIEREVSAGATLLEADIRATSFYLIIEGEFRVVVLHADGDLEVGRVAAGKSVGEATLFSEDHRSSSRMTAVTRARVLEIPYARYWSYWKDNPDLASVITRELIDQMSERARNVDQLINDRLQKAAFAPENPLGST